jgi:hypothetical protein
MCCASPSQNVTAHLYDFLLGSWKLALDIDTALSDQKTCIEVLMRRRVVLEKWMSSIPWRSLHLPGVISRGGALEKVSGESFGDAVLPKRKC